MAWEFWIDVGGTFTDCFARLPDGSLKRHKLLSSGITKGSAGAGSNRGQLIDPARRYDPPDFWRGYLARLLDHAGQPVAEARVAAFDLQTGRLSFAAPFQAEPQSGQHYELVSNDEAPIVGIRYLLGLAAGEPMPPVSVRLGTTRGTNALLTRRGAATGLVTTRGFGDILHIGYQNRRQLFALNVKKPAPLFAAVAEIDERLSADGQVLLAPHEEQIRDELQRLKTHGIESLAICLLHSFAQPAHEELVARVARELGFEEVSVSHRVAPLVKIVARGDTTVVDAYLNPVLRRYVERLRSALGGGELRMMTSAGGLVAADQFVGKDSILSGPAGGVVGFSRAARLAGFERAIGFDMGGTSTDVARFDGRFELEYETEKAGTRIVAPMLAIETVAAGGGSICDFDGVKLVVGPHSAGAEPGPACYGRGGPLAVTDLNFYLGKIVPDFFPFPLDRGAVERRLDDLIERVAATGRRYSREELCDGLVRVANSNMVKAIQSISVAKGYDPRDYVLVAFGGAAGQHACAVAAELGMRRVLSHPDAGLLSAYGIGLADVARHRVAGVYQAYTEAAVAGLAATFDRLIDDAHSEVLAEGVPAERIETRRLLDLRYRGLDAFLTIPQPPAGTYAEAYDAEHERLYGYRQAGRELEIVAIRVEVVGAAADYDPPRRAARPRDAQPEKMAAAWFDASARQAGVFDRASLAPGDRLLGPAIIHEQSATTIIDAGWRGEVLERGELLLTYEGGSVRSGIRENSEPGPRPDSLRSGIRENSEPGPRPDFSRSQPPVSAQSGLAQSQPAAADPVLLEIFNNQFAGIAEQMGITLRNTASSVNVKERLDFSCAIFTATGDLVVNAPHIPVHLGAMGETVKRLLADNAEMRPGDVFVTNDPYRGGSHLPDITVVTPIFGSDEPREILFFTASRAHHAEIGGIRPGSMPPFSRNLAEEGVLIRDFKLVDAGRSRLAELGELLASGPYPSRAVADNLADISAQVAANHQGARDLHRLIERHGLPLVTAYMGHIQQAAERKMRAALARIADGEYRFVDHLDDGSPIAVAITIAGDSATIDFTGTAPVSPGNLNANRAIVTAAVMYTLRSLIDEEIPLNQGVLAPVRIVLPEGLLNPPAGQTPALSPGVVGGNVETSQRVVDVLLGALSLAAASQGTMNNLLFGDDTFGYYETICGGAGATAAAAGADAIHTHMTNTRLTDPEVLERRYPVRLREFRIRRGSGGAGRHRGGDGVVRRIEFLKSLDVSILSQRRGPYAPYGLAGGQPGALGRNLLERTDGQHEELPGLVQFRASPGDVLTLETPGGGGYGGGC